MTFELSRSPQQVFEDHIDVGGPDLVYTNTSSCQIVITGVVMALNGVPGDFGWMKINGALVAYIVLEGTEAFKTATINAEIILGPTDTITMSNQATAGTLGFVISGWLYNPNG